MHFHKHSEDPVYIDFKMVYTKINLFSNYIFP